MINNTSRLITQIRDLVVPSPKPRDDDDVENKKELLIDRLAELLGGKENARNWLDSPNPVLGGRTPQSYSSEGKLTDVLSYFIMAIETGQSS